MTVATHYFKEIPVPQWADEKCGICIVPFKDSAQKVVAHNGAIEGSTAAVFHTFHKSCLQGWFKQQQTIPKHPSCPECRGKAKMLLTPTEMQEEIEKLQARPGDRHEEKEILDLLRVFAIGAIAILPITACIYYAFRGGYLALGIQDYADFSWFWKGSWETRMARMSFNNIAFTALGSALLMAVGIAHLSISPLGRDRDQDPAVQREREIETLTPWFFHQWAVATVFAIYCTRTWRGQEIPSLLEKGRFTAFVITPLLSGISAATIHLFRKNFLGTPLPR